MERNYPSRPGLRGAKASGAVVSRPRARDIARAAGVSTATVDRVLNRRLGVRVATAQRVVEAAATLDYLPRAALYESLRPKPMRLSFLLPAGTNRYLRMLGEHISASDEQLRAFNVTSHCHFVEGFNPEALARSLRHHARRADGIAFMALDHPVVKPVLSRVSVRRMDYLAASFRQAGLPRLDAQNRARLAYAAYVGFLQLALQLGQPRLHRDELEAYVRHVATTLIPD